MEGDLVHGGGVRQLVDGEFFLEGSMRQEIGIAPTADVQDSTSTQPVGDEPIGLSRPQPSQGTLKQAVPTGHSQRVSPIVSSGHRSGLIRLFSRGRRAEATRWCRVTTGASRGANVPG